MQPVEIKKDIFWVGCVDYDHRDFHGYSRSPDGSTYNAYLIKDQKNVLIDTVAPGLRGHAALPSGQDPGTRKSGLHRLQPHRTGPFGLPGRSGGAGQAGKNFRLPGRAQVHGRVFRGQELAVQAVKSGDILNIGSRNIVFQETRMLHWPDSMVSYIPEEKLLISNDIFGQNIASSARFADDFGDDGEFVKRIKEYFYNIILPYSPMVLKTLPVVENWTST